MTSWNSKDHSAHQQAYLVRKKAGLVTTYERRPTDEPCPACSGTGKQHKTVRVYVPRAQEAQGGPEDLS